MAGGLRRLLRQLSAASDDELVRLLLSQLDATLDGARLARTATGERPTHEAREQMKLIERAGDHARAALVGELGRSLVTPVDREDLFRLSRSVDDVLDNLRDFVREMDLLRIGCDGSFVPVIDAVVDAVRALSAAVATISDEPEGAAEASLAAKKACNEIRRRYQHAVADLLNQDDVDTLLLKRRELLRRLDVVGLRLGEAADALADGVLKRGY